MNILINRIAGEVTVNGVTRAVDLSALDENIDSVTFNEVSGNGVVNSDSHIGRTLFNQLYAKYVQAWKAIDAPSRTLAEVKEDHKIYMNSIRDSIEQNGFPYEVNGVTYTFDSNPVSAQRIALAALAATNALAAGQGLLVSFDWTTKDNQVVAMSALDLAGMPAALAAYSNTLHQIAKARKAAIDAASTIEEVEAVTWD